MLLLFFCRKKLFTEIFLPWIFFDRHTICSLLLERQSTKSSGSSSCPSRFDIMWPIHLYLKWLPDVRRLHLSRLPLFLHPPAPSTRIPLHPQQRIALPLFSTNYYNTIFVAEHIRRLRLSRLPLSLHPPPPSHPQQHIVFPLFSTFYPDILHIVVQIGRSHHCPLFSTYIQNILCIAAHTRRSHLSRLPLSLRPIHVLYMYIHFMLQYRYKKDCVSADFTSLSAH